MNRRQTLKALILTPFVGLLKKDDIVIITPQTANKPRKDRICLLGEAYEGDTLTVPKGERWEVTSIWCHHSGEPVKYFGIKV